MDDQVKGWFGIAFSAVALLGTLAAGLGIAFDVQAVTDLLTKWQGIALMAVAAISTFLQGLPALWAQAKGKSE